MLVLAVAIGSDPCTNGAGGPSATADREIPPSWLVTYRQAGTRYGIPWPILAAVGAIETDHGRSSAPGVHSGVNAFGCCAGPTQFNLRNGPPSTWQSYHVDGDADSDTDPYDPADAIASAAHYLNALLDQARGNLAAAVYGYNHSQAYVTDVLTRARAYGDTPLVAPADHANTTACVIAPIAGQGPANLTGAERQTRPRAYATLPSWAMATGRPAQAIDARLLNNAL